METKNYFIVEVKKARNWESGFLNWKGEVVEDIKEAQQFEEEEDAENEASLFNMEYSSNGEIFARVR